MRAYKHTKVAERKRAMARRQLRAAVMYSQPNLRPRRMGVMVDAFVKHLSQGIRNGSIRLVSPSGRLLATSV